MVILNQKRQNGTQVPAGADLVIAGVAVPRNGAVVQVSGHLDVMPTARLPIDSLTNFSVRMYLIPMPDFDTQDSYDDIWDRFVPKDDAATDTIDVDESAADSDEVDTLGIPDLESIMGIRGTKLTSVYKRGVEWSYASKPMYPTHDQITPFTDEFFWPAERFPININRKVGTPEPALLLLAVSNPVTTNTTSTGHSSPTIQEWGRMTMMDETLKQMKMAYLGETEAGATVIWTEAQALAVKLMEPPVVESGAVAGHYLESTLQASCKLNFKVQYPEMSIRREISSSPA